MVVGEPFILPISLETTDWETFYSMSAWVLSVNNWFTIETRVPVLPMYHFAIFFHYENNDIYGNHYMWVMSKPHSTHDQ